MNVHLVDTGRPQEVIKFVDLPFRLYQGCPKWVPPLLSASQGMLNRRKHPFYRHSTAAFFLAESDGQVVGRIGVFHNRNYNRYRGTRVAFFGLYESRNDIHVARALFSAACDWAHDQGLEEMVGPRGLIGSDGGGVLVDGFDYRPAMGIPYNLTYYDSLIRDCGFAKDTDYLSGYLPGNYRLPEQYHRVVERVKGRSGFWIKTFASKHEMRRWIPSFAAAHHKAFSQTHTYYPPTDEELDLIADTLLMVAHPRLVKLVMKGDEIVGFLLGIPDVSEALQKARGRLWPTGWYHLILGRRRTRWVNINGLGMLPEYRGLGGTALLYIELAKSIHEFGFQHVDLVQMEEGNLKSMAELDGLGDVHWYKRHRSYHCLL